MKLQRTILLFICLVTLLYISPAKNLLASESTFRSTFIDNYISNLFKQQEILVRKNKTIIPGEIKALTDDALAEDTSYDKQMFLLNIAHSMASMHKHWNNDEKPLAEVEAIIDMELAKEKERRAKLEKWDKYEKFLGNFVMKEHEVRMEQEGLTPVIYPHWLHRIWFECKVCHEGLFVSIRGANDISQDHLLKGEQCGVCHDNTMAFGADRKEDCEKCHIAGKPEAEHLYDMDNVDHRNIKGVADRLGTAWIPENLPEGKMPLDRYGFIDWLYLKEQSVFSPLVSLDRSEVDQVKDDTILFKSTSPFLDNVLFSHNIHSTWIKCSTCHPVIFKPELGGNTIRMKDMATGKFCGHCHGRVSFTFANCMGCHRYPKGEQVEGALIRNTEQ
jgi:c(7)-type cytochrome triheme protein